MCSEKYICFVIQIKICAEYRDMLPRPRLVCQDGPKARRTWQPAEALVECTGILYKSFIAYIFHFFISSVGLVGHLTDCRHAEYPVPLYILIRMRLLTKQCNLPTCLPDVQLDEITLAFTELMKLIHKMGSFQHKNQVNEQLFANL